MRGGGIFKGQNGKALGLRAGQLETEPVHRPPLAALLWPAD